MVIGAASANPGAGKLRDLADRFRFVADVPGEVERIIQKDVPFENIGQWLDKLGLARRAVCRIEPQPGTTDGYGTGFLIAPDVIMTNFHVVQSFPARGPGDVVLRFDYETGVDGVSVPTGRLCHLAADWKLAESPLRELDFALVRIVEPAADDAVPGGMRGLCAWSRTTSARAIR